jgi:hypothetical protein
MHAHIAGNTTLDIVLGRISSKSHLISMNKNRKLKKRRTVMTANKQSTPPPELVACAFVKFRGKAEGK